MTDTQPVVVPIRDDDAAENPVMESEGVYAWFGDHLVLGDINLTFRRGQVTALIGPSGCGKSTFLRILNRLHEMTPSAAFAGKVMFDGEDVYGPGVHPTELRRKVGMVFQKANPFPAMTVYDNVLAGLTFTNKRPRKADDIVERSLRRAGLWNEVQKRLKDPGGALSGGQQQRLCIARSLAVDPEVLLMDEPCSALDPGSTRRIEETITEIADDVTIVIVTHNMQQAARVAQRCAFFLAEDGNPGRIVEEGTTDQIFHAPLDPKTADYVEGRFG